MDLFFATLAVTFVLITKFCLIEAFFVVVFGTCCVLLGTAHEQITEEWRQINQRDIRQRQRYRDSS